MKKHGFTKNRKNSYFLENRKIQPHSLFKGTTAGDASLVLRTCVLFDDISDRSWVVSGSTLGPGRPRVVPG